MTYAKRIIFTFVATRKSRQPASLSNAQHGIATSGENLVWIGLMTNVPDQAVVGCIEHVV